jgi:flagellar hook-length control protein FliK
VPAAVTADAAAAWLTAQAGAEPKVSNARPAISESLAAPAREGPKPELPVQTLASAAVPPAPVPGVALDTVSRPLPGLPDIPVLHQIARAVDVMQQGGGHEVRLQLQPPALGQLLVQLRVSGSDVSVHMLAETAQAQSVIRDHLPELKAALAAQGLQADKMAVTIGNHLSAFDMGYRQPEGWEQYQAYPAVTPVAETESVVERGAAPTPADNLHAVDYQV